MLCLCAFIVDVISWELVIAMKVIFKFSVSSLGSDFLMDTSSYESSLPSCEEFLHIDLFLGCILLDSE